MGTHAEVCDRRYRVLFSWLDVRDKLAVSLGIVECRNATIVSISRLHEVDAIPRGQVSDIVLTIWWISSNTNIFRYIFNYVCKIPGFISHLNKILNNAMDRAKNYTEEKHEELQKKSDNSPLNIIL